MVHGIRTDSHTSYVDEGRAWRESATRYALLPLRVFLGVTFIYAGMDKLTNSALLAVTASNVLQTAYHLYQGLQLALCEGALFLFFSIYYAKTNRIMPVILAHLYIDLSGTLIFYLRHLHEHA